MIPAADLDHIVAFERGAPSENDYGDEILTWGPLETVAARVRYGTGEERREAAQEQALQPATIMVNWNPILAGVVPKDRAVFDNSTWDIAGPPARVGLNDELHFEAVRNA